MPFSNLKRWLKPAPAKKPARARLALEGLEAREVPAVYNWTGPFGGLWSTAANWNNGNGPAPSNADPHVQIVFNGGSISVQNVPNLFVESVVFVAGDSLVQMNANLRVNADVGGVQIQSNAGYNTFSGSGHIEFFSGANNVAHIFTLGGSTIVTDVDLTGDGGVLKSGAGTLQFEGSADYDGRTDVPEGKLILNHQVASGSARALPDTPLRIGNINDPAGTAEVRLYADRQLSFYATITVEKGQLLSLNSHDAFVGGLQLNGGTVDVAGGELLVVGDIVAQYNSSSIVDGSTGGSVNLQSARTITVHNGVNLTVAAPITGAGGVVKEGAGTLTYDLNGTKVNTYTGTTTVKAGGLLLDTEVDGAFAGDLVIGNGGLFDGAYVKLLSSAPIPVNKNTTVKLGGTLDLNGHLDGIGSLTLHGGAKVEGNGGALLLFGDVTVAQTTAVPASITGNVQFAGLTRTFTVADNFNGSDLVIDGVITGAGAKMVKAGPGRLEIKGAGGNTPNTYTGTLVADGVLMLTDSGANGATNGPIQIGDGVGNAGSARLLLGASFQIPDNTAVTVLGDGVLDFGAAFSDVIGSLTLSGGSAKTGGYVIVKGPVTATAGTSSTVTGNWNVATAPQAINVEDGALLTVTGQLYGAGGGVTKSGNGRLVLNGTHTYTGPTTVAGGVFAVNGSIVSPLTLTGGTLTGTGAVGTIGGTGGTIEPGSGGKGTLSSKAATLGGVTFSPRVGDPASFGQLKVTGAVNLTGATLAGTLGGSPLVGTQFRVIDNDLTDAVTGTFNGLPEGGVVAIGGRPFRITYQGGDGGNDVVLTALPALPGDYAAGADAGGGPVVKTFSPDGVEKGAMPAFEDGFGGGVRTATGDVTGDGVADLIVGSGPGRVAEVRIYDGSTNQLVRSVLPFADFTGGVFVAAGDFDNDGKADVVVTPDQSGGPRVTVLSGNDGGVLANFFGIDDANFRGGARAAIGDVNADGRADLVISAGFGGGPRIAVFDGASLGGTPTRLMPDFFAFEQGLRNGAYVAAGDLNGDAYADLIFGGGPGGGPRVLALDGHDMAGGNSTVLANFFAGNAANRGGVRVAAKNLDNDTMADLVVGDGTGAGSRVTSYLGKNFAGGTAPENSAFDAFAGFLGGVFVG